MTLGTLAAVGLTRSEMPYKGVIMGIMLSPMIVPLIISAAGMYFFYARFSDFTSGYVGIILAHTVLGTPFVVITVTATLSGFDDNLIRASKSLGANGWTTFYKVVMPLITPGIISGGLFAFITSFDEVVAALFLTSAEESTITIQMWSGIREEISPTILAVATLLITFSVLLL
jgi:ABC-type spermidine/putrescine transport system, permease component II